MMIIIVAVVVIIIIIKSHIVRGMHSKELRGSPHV